MTVHRRWILAINLSGGSAVIASYIWGLVGRPGAADLLWGGVPEAIRPCYSAGMFLAAAGYFAFSYFLVFRMDSAKTDVFRRYSARLFSLLYAGILLPSAFWMPATFWAVGNPSGLAVGLVRGVLILVALFSLGLLAALLGIRPREPAWAHVLAVIGSVCFCLQTVVLDAVVWGSLFSP
jgi:hypothetical protein